MVASGPRCHLVRHQSPACRWELAMRRPAACLQPYVREHYTGYVEETPAPLQRRELPAPLAALIFDLGPPLRLLDLDDPTQVSRYPGGFFAGIGERPALTEHDGVAHGIQVNLTPIGARLFAGAPMSAFADRVVALEDVAGADGREISERLAGARDWDARFDLLDDFLARRITRARVDSRPVAWALGQIEASGGLVDIGGLARELGYSARHLIALFRDRVGLPPKQLARLHRFDRVVALVKRGDAGGWASIAVACGFYDQAHLIRDVRHFSGLTPTALAQTLAGDAGAVLYQQVNSVQAAAGGAT
jgi:AraC-like DNA-binding protein